MDALDLEKINSLLDADVNIKDKIRDQVTEFDKKSRTMVGLLNKIHSTPPESIPALLDSVRPTLNSCKETSIALSTIVPQDQFWRWKDMWSNSLRSVVFSAALIEYLSHGTLISLPQIIELLGITPESQNRFDLPPEDYLHGIISLVNELSRLAVNSVTLGNFQEPIKISFFVKDIFSGFTMLNLKNDLLRKRFDSLKYDLKKIEEVVYDISLRKLVVPKVPST